MKYKIEFRIGCQIVCQNIGQIECQMDRHIECQNVCIYIYIHAMGAKFSDTSCFWMIGHFENCVLAVVICNLLSIVICLDLMFDGRFFCVSV